MKDSQNSKRRSIYVWQWTKEFFIFTVDMSLTILPLTFQPRRPLTLILLWWSWRSQWSLTMPLTSSAYLHRTTAFLREHIVWQPDGDTRRKVANPYYIFQQAIRFHLCLNENLSRPYTPTYTSMKYLDRPSTPVYFLSTEHLNRSSTFTCISKKYLYVTSTFTSE